MSETKKVSAETPNDAPPAPVPELPPSKEEKGQAKSHLYSIMFSTWHSYAAIIPSMLIGSGSIVLFYLFGLITNQLSLFAISYKQNQVNPASPIYDPLPEIQKVAYYLAIMGGVLGIASFLDNYLWTRIGSILSTKVRSDLFLNMMKSEVTFFDVNPIGSVLKLLLEDAQLVQNCFGHTKGTQIQNITTFLTGIILGFVYSWKLSLILLALFPVMGIIMGSFSPFISKHSIANYMIGAKCVTIAQEALSSMRTVKSFNSEDNESNRFDQNAIMAVKEEQTVGYLVMGMMQMIVLVLYGSLVALLYYSGTFVEKSILAGNKDFLIGDMLAFYGFCLFGCFGLMMIQGSITQEEKAFTAGARIAKLMEHVPSVQFDGGIEPADFKGHIEFKNVTFHYPSRDQNVLINVSFEVLPHQIIALVGHSGSGKSTCIQLIERFYDVNEGMILIDGHDIKEYNPRWLHRQIGLVQQEPTLFSGSIMDNIKYGNFDATQEEILAAAEIANASKFINKFENKFSTKVGEKGSSLSGGQRQRIAIARAIVKNPAILMTDEATSALDSNSEKKVQDALDKIMKNRTAIIVAHRLSTIKNAEIIYVFDQGEIKEYGKHEELVAKKGVYFNLVSKQLTNSIESTPIIGDQSKNEEQASQKNVDSKDSSDHSSSSSESNK